MPAITRRPPPARAEDGAEHPGQVGRDHDKSAAGRKARPRLAPAKLAHHVQDDVERTFGCRVPVIGCAFCAELPGQVVVRRRGGGRDPGSKMAADLDGGPADRPCRPTDQETLARCKSGTVDQELGGGQTAKKEGGTLGEAKRVGKGQQAAVGRDCQVVTMRATLEAHEAEDPLARGKARRAAAEPGNFAGEGPARGDTRAAEADGEAKHQAKSARHPARPQAGVPGRDRCGVNADQHLFGGGGGDRGVGEDHGLGRAVGGVAGDLHAGTRRIEGEMRRMIHSAKPMLSAHHKA